jgi:hypothetical protein
MGAYKYRRPLTDQLFILSSFRLSDMICADRSLPLKRSIPRDIWSCRTLILIYDVLIQPQFLPYLAL